ncbi:hypothetical protein EST38_g12666 [Candolleomyces aberdarensis]|uniref:NACHT domain-containing protein n=1 Tax=Candolleomyces aberdarensis TaxID=2316362 RepID=A0A4Q2D439_9AGAR|nr:hypothetical protein EST38_g12666 [Candolleomyces aberdarensis]
MAEFTQSGGGDNHGFPDNPERNTPIPAQAATPGTDGGRPPSTTRGFRAWVGEKYDKGKTKVERGTHKVDKRVKSLLDRGKPKNEGEGERTPQDTGGSSKVGAIAMGTFKTALGIAATLVPGSFKGSAEALLKVVDIIEKVDSNEEEVQILKKRCELLGSSIVNVVKGKDTKLLSKDLRDRIGRLVAGMWTTLEAANKGKSMGFAAYVLAEDDVEVLKKANKSLDELLHCFWIENHIAGTIVLADILSTAHHQAGHLERVPGAAYDSQEVAAKIMPCFEGTRSTLLANVGRWMIGATDDGHSPPLYILDGIAGIGKSTVAITVAQRAADPSINCLGATFFFSRDQEDRKKSLGFVHTIAYQLAHYHASYGKAIAAAITSNPEALDKVLTQQFSLLIAKPLHPLLKQRATPLVLVFDALDECVDGSAVLSLIISSISQLPNVKVFLTSRPELELRTKYMVTQNVNIFHLQEIEDLVVEHDISLYVNYHLSLPKIQEALGDSYDTCWQPTAEDKAKLAKLSGKLFIYASTAVKFILDKQHLDPKGQLASLLDLQSDSPSSLSQLEKWLIRFKMIVGAILVLQTPLSVMALASLLVEEQGAIKGTLGNLHAILAPLGEGSAPTYKVHHKSFPDFITGSSCPSEFRIVEEEHHLQLAKYCLQVMNRQLRMNICQVPVPSEDQFKDLDDLLKGGLTN